MFLTNTTVISHYTILLAFNNNSLHNTQRLYNYCDLTEKEQVENSRKYGNVPFRVAVIHGGPGAAGEMAPVAHKLSSFCGILEPLQTVKSLKGQIEELKSILIKHVDFPVTLYGFSWGAWLSFIFAAKYPEFVKKLILIGSGPFDEKYTGNIQDTRLNHLNEKDRLEAMSLIEALDSYETEDKNTLFARLGKLLSKADAFKPIDQIDEVIEYSFDIFKKVWKETSKLRKSGKLLELGKNIECPVVAIHGDYNPHPAEGVEKPLTAILKDFRFILLKKYGHKPWIEKHARNLFYKIIEQELK
jgi:pimeloyl-ACP methyl ester carboxylesterase